MNLDIEQQLRPCSFDCQTEDKISIKDSNFIEGSNDLVIEFVEKVRKVH